MQDVFYQISQALEIVSFAIMIYGALIGIVLFLRNEIRRLQGKFELDDLNRIRVDFGYYILLGLEFLIAADIIETILKPTNAELVELGGIVAIRIVLSFFLTREINELNRPEHKKNES